MKQLILLALSALALSSIGCAHFHPVQAVSPKMVLPEGYRVKVGGLEVKEGQILNVSKNVCEESNGKFENLKNCKVKNIGKTEVLKVLDDDSAIVAAKDNLRMDETMLITHENIKE